MKFQNKKQIQFTIRVILLIVVLYDAWTDTIILRQINERLFEEGVKYEHVTMTVVNSADLKSLENELKLKISNKTNEVCGNINETLDKPRVSALCCTANYHY